MPQNRSPKKFSVKVYNKRHVANLNKRLNRVQQLIDEAAKQATRIAVRCGYSDASKDFRFDDFPQARREIDTLLGQLSSSLSANVESATSEAWGLANIKNDAMVDAMLASTGVSLPKKATRPWYNKNERALRSFIDRREKGMGLSSDVWRLDQFKKELELSLEMGLGSGESAAELSRDVRSFLKYPDKLFRRVRDEKGVLRLSRAASEFHPGQGVYRSSYKNALRLTATETNMAYRTADSKRWQQIDFVTGIEIHTSQTNHPEVDICDELQGEYPKDFVFTGWHPFCKCFATSKLASPEEFMKYQQAILDGEDVSDWQFSGEVKDVPENFKEWVQDNEERISRAKSLPYFIKDNPEYFNRAVNNVESVGSDTTVSVMSNEKMEKIRMDAYDMLSKHDNERIAKLIGEYEDDVLLDESNEVRSSRLAPVESWLNTMRKADARHAARTAADIRRIQDLADLHTYGQDYVDNVHKLEKALGMQRGKRMNHEQANMGRVNPNFGKPGFETNCSTCSGTYILRRMGFDVEAKANIQQNALVELMSKDMNTWDKWIGGKQNYHNTYDWMVNNGLRTMNENTYRMFLDEYTKVPGIYELNVGYRGGGGHSTLLERKNDGTLVRIEQQTTSKGHTLDNLLKSLRSVPEMTVRGVMRVDNAKYNPAYAGAVRKVK